MVSLEDLKTRVSTAIFTTAGEIQKTHWGHVAEVPDASLNNTIIAILHMQDGTVHVGSYQRPDGSEPDFVTDRDEAAGDAYSRALEYYTMAEAAGTPID